MGAIASALMASYGFAGMARDTQKRREKVLREVAQDAARMETGIFIAHEDMRKTVEMLQAENDKLKLQLKELTEGGYTHGA